MVRKKKKEKQEKRRKKENIDDLEISIDMTLKGNYYLSQQYLVTSKETLSFLIHSFVRLQTNGMIF